LTFSNFQWCLQYFLRLALKDIFGVVLSIVGSVLNAGGEILRNQWKKNPDSKGEIYTQGFFKYSRHINYFGSML
jgi:steroid 5-alpha reductase family enzyme